MLFRSKLKEKLAKFMNVTDAEYTDIEPVEEKDIDPENPDAQ